MSLKFKLLPWLATLNLFLGLHAQTPLLNHLCQEANYIFVGKIEDSGTNWQMVISNTYIIKVDYFLKNVRPVEMAKPNRVKVELFQTDYFVKGKIAPIIRIGQGDKHIFFAQKIEKINRKGYIRVWPDTTNLSYYTAKEVQVHECRLTDFWINTLVHSKELEDKLRLELESFEPTWNSALLKSKSRDSMVVYAQKYIDLGEITNITKRENSPYMYTVDVKILGDTTNTDSHVLRTEKETIFVKSLHCICNNQLTVGKIYSFFLRKEGDIYILTDPLFGIFENVVWNWNVFDY